MKKFRFRKIKRHTPIISVILNCLNCGKPLASDDNFCSYCGQKYIEKLSFASFIRQLTSGLFSYDSRFWTTFIPLLFKPGKVSRNYIEGKRKRYVNPFQLYLHVSILFFLIFGWTTKTDLNFDPNINTSNQVVIDSVLNHNNINLDTVSKKNLDSLLIETKVQIDSINKKVITKLASSANFPEIFLDSIYNINQKEDSIEFITLIEKIDDFYVFGKKNPSISNSNNALSTLGYPINFWNCFNFKQTQIFKRNLELLENGNVSRLLKKAMSHLSIGLFIFLPIFTFSLKFFYLRKHMNYMEHLVFVFHTQTVFFLLLLISTLISLFTKYDKIWVFLLLFLIYLFLALQEFYQQGKFKTFIKFILLNCVYSTLGTIAVAIISILTFML